MPVRATVAERHGARLDGAAAAFPPLPATTIDVSRKVPSTLGHEYWLRFRAPSPRRDEDVWAHVYDQDGVTDPSSLISLHGIAMETDMWKQISEPDVELLRHGFHVISACAPRHARRTPTGCYGGQIVMAQGPFGFIELFEAWVGEIAVLIGWLRQSSKASVAVARHSLGALTTRLVGGAASGRPVHLRPDAIALTAISGDVVETVLRGSVARALGTEHVLGEHGWSCDDVESWHSLLEPQAQPATPPDRVVMVLGAADTLTPYSGGAALAEAWEIPPQNMFIRPRGHFTVGFGAYNDTAPLLRLAEIVAQLAAR